MLKSVDIGCREVELAAYVNFFNYIAFLDTLIMMLWFILVAVVSYRGVQP